MDSHPAPVRDAVALVESRCLRRGVSLFTPRRRLWTVDGLDGLARRLDRAARRASARDRPGTAFDERWRRALARADAPTVALATEVLYVHLLFPTSIGGPRKRALLAASRPQRGQAGALPRRLDAALDHGVAPVGLAYTRQRLTQLAWLADAAARFAQLPRTQRAAVLDDPRRTAAAFPVVAPREGAAQRAALLHLLHPGTFAPITSATVRTSILRAFAAHVPPDEPDPDLALAALRAALAPVHGAGFSFFDPEVAPRWQ